MVSGVCALILRGDKILGVSRKYDPNDFGLPGGKMEEGESQIETLVREVKEETGLDVISQELLYYGNDGQREAFCYFCEVTGEVYTEELGVVKDVTWEELFNGTFGDYNRRVYETFINKTHE